MKCKVNPVGFEQFKMELSIREAILNFALVAQWIEQARPKGKM